VGPGADAEVVVGLRYGELLEEDLRHAVVIVLAGVDEDLLVNLAELPRDRSALDELRPGADDRDNLHGYSWIMWLFLSPRPMPL
jgi:hypothetical protein